MNNAVSNRIGRLTRRRSRSAPPAKTPSKSKRSTGTNAATNSTRQRHRFVEQHYVIDKDTKILLPGVPVHQNDVARDMHDFFNLIVLVPIIVLNILNWNWELLLKSTTNNNTLTNGFPTHAWHGDLFTPFFLTTTAYFLIDLLWVILQPHCVKSPTTIIQHHIATLLYITIPYYYPQVQWAMGVCMSVEINTWFLIARRVFNRQGFPPWTIGLPYILSVRVKLISICFYMSWVGIRCCLFPFIMVEYVRMYRAKDVMLLLWGWEWNVMGVCLVIHSVFCVLNGKWTMDLVNSKVRQWRKGGGVTRAESGL